ncbi:hypothetical protein [Paenibacillus qinlingensis]|uniref:DUF3600 domain-containing protein n=1 Tax=Paenibacillus qinlingensis TaxID=1837343 RepID=A0ABU1NTZ3_9BACL|nr:hypothetical protein [Paenibacillus qinlingensis]MDR6550934.1 hypothetical protein [Paenibacillus qinlingensis]
MKSKQNDYELESRVSKMFTHAVENENSSIKYADIANKALSQSTTLFRKKTITLLIALCLILVIPTVSYAISGISIGELFAEMKLKINQHERDENKTVAIVEGVNILVKDFVFYKANLELIWKLNDVNVSETNMDLLMDMIKEQLIVQYALEKGYSVSNEEINIYILNLKNQLNQPDAPREMKEIMANRIKLTGLSEEDYWKSPDTIKAYRDLLLKDKVGKNLNMNVTDYDKFKEEIWVKKKDAIQIYKENLK